MIGIKNSEYLAISLWLAPQSTDHNQKSKYPCSVGLVVSVILEPARGRERGSMDYDGLDKVVSGIRLEKNMK